jgi:peroxidase
MPGTLLLAAVLTAAAAAVVVVDGQLSPTFYDAACPALPSIVRRGMAQAVQKEARMGASVLRLFFHDCFVNVRFDSFRSATNARRSCAR